MSSPDWCHNAENYDLYCISSTSRFKKYKCKNTRSTYQPSQFWALETQYWVSHHQHLICFENCRNFNYVHLEYPLAPQKSYILIKVRLKRAWNYAYLAPQNCICTYKFWQKRDWNCAFMVPPNTHSLMKRSFAPLQPPEIIYFCKFRPKRPEIMRIQLAK